jgi:hypothetical protein
VGLKGLRATARGGHNVRRCHETKAKSRKGDRCATDKPEVEDAARNVKVAPRTLYRWLLEPQFDKAYRKARRSVFGQGAARLQQASSAAVSSVLKIMVDQQASASTRLRAADLVLTHGARAIEIDDIEARLAELERAAEAARALKDDEVTA